MKKDLLTSFNKILKDYGFELIGELYLTSDKDFSESDLVKKKNKILFYEVRMRYKNELIISRICLNQDPDIIFRRILKKYKLIPKDKLKEAVKEIYYLADEINKEIIVCEDTIIDFKYHQKTLRYIRNELEKIIKLYSK